MSLTAGDRRLPLEYGVVSKLDTNSALQWTLLVQAGYIRAFLSHVVVKRWFWKFAVDCAIIVGPQPELYHAVQCHTARSTELPSTQLWCSQRRN